MNQAEREALHGTFHRLEQRWNVLPVPDGDAWHAYDPLPFWEFLAGVQAASELTKGRRFLDLGCGIGTKLSIMHALGWEVFGIDRHEPYVRAAHELIPEACVEVCEITDLASFDADLVYMYRPAISDELEVEVEATVLSRAAPGTVMFWPYRHQPEVWMV